MRDAVAQIEMLDAEIRLLEKQKAGDWRERIVTLLERRREVERTLETEVNVYES